MAFSPLNDGALLDNISLDKASGTGTYNTFLRLQANGTESGFNSDEDVLDVKQGTHSIQIGQLERVTVEGEEYFLFRLDLQESDNVVTLSELKIFLSEAAATEDDFDADFDGFDEVFTLSAPLVLPENGSGNGHDDYGFLIPVSAFGDFDDEDYLTLFSTFTGASSSFEEWRALASESPPGGEDVLAYSIVKTVTDVDGAGALGVVDEAGDEIDYQIVVTNTGNVDLNGVSVSDPLLGGVLTGAVESITADGVLQVGETWTYTKSYTATQADIDNNGGADGDIDNTATVSHSILDDLSSSAFVPIDQEPGVQIVKTGTVDGGTADAAGEIISYTIEVSNTGNMSLTGVEVEDAFVDDLAAVDEDDDTFNDGDTDKDGKLDLDETWQYTASHTVTQDEIDAGGTIDNTATVTTDQDVTDEDDESIEVEQKPSILVTKTNGGVVDKNGNGDDDAGDEIVYEYNVENDGNVTLFNISLDDDKLGDITLTGLTDEDNDGQSDDLAVGATATGTATATLSQADVEAGTVTNIATGTGTDPNEDPVTDDDTNTVVLELNSDGYSQGFWKTHANGKNSAWDDGIATNTGYEAYLGIDTGLAGSLTFKQVLDTANLKPVQANQELALAKQVVAAFLNAADSIAPNATSDFQFDKADITAAVASVYDGTGFNDDDDGDGLRDSEELQKVLDFYNKENVTVQGNDPHYIINLSGTDPDTNHANFLSVFG
jgi:uncharacterized repeat protein (TIGR01451 family)